MNKKYLFPIILMLGISCLLYWAYHKNAEKPIKQLKVYGNEGHRIKDFSFINQYGRSLSLKDIAGKVMAVEFFFTQCQSICPVMNIQMMRVDSAFKLDTNFMILSHTVKPDEDSISALLKYANDHHASKHWFFLTGNREDLYKTGRESYLLDADGIPDFLHTPFFALVDKRGRLRGFYDGTKKTEVDEMIGDVQLLISE